MRESSLNRLTQVWLSENTRYAQRSTQHDPKIIQDILGSIFCPGPFYYFIMDFATLSFTYFHENMYEMIGVEPHEAQLPNLIKKVHPEDLPFMTACEKKGTEFMFQYLPPEKMLYYKVSYCYRILCKDNQYRLFLHQAIGLSLESSNRLGNVLGVHTDISKLTTHNNRTISFIGLNGEPSYYNVPVDVEGFNDSSAQFTTRELEILRWLAEGASTTDIAQVLSISPGTVRKHRENMLHKSDSKNTTQLVASAIRHGLI